MCLGWCLRGCCLQLPHMLWVCLGWCLRGCCLMCRQESGYSCCHVAAAPESESGVSTECCTIQGDCEHRCSWLGIVLCFGVAFHVGLWFPNQGWHPYPLQWKCGVLTPGPLVKSLELHFNLYSLSLLSESLTTNSMLFFFGIYNREFSSFS